MRNRHSLFYLLTLAEITMQTHTRGVLYAVTAGVFLSSGGLIVRFIDSADAWLLLFYRSLAFFVTVLVFMALRERGQLVRQFCCVRLRDLIVSFALAFGFIFYVLSLYNTTVANTVLLLSTGPLFAAFLGWIVLRESVSRATWIAMLIAIVGIGVMVSGGLAAGDILGAWYAVLAVLSFAVLVVALRSSGDRDMLPATALAGLVAAVCCVPMIDSFQISLRDMLLALTMGSVQVGFGFILITLASRSVPAAQVPLLALGETALAPLWVWLFVAEVPDTRTLIGGGIVIAALVYQGLRTETAP